MEQLQSQKQLEAGNENLSRKGCPPQPLKIEWFISYITIEREQQEKIIPLFSLVNS